MSYRPTLASQEANMSSIADMAKQLASATERKKPMTEAKTEQDNQQNAAEMPRYKCHKEVHALEISIWLRTDDGYLLRFKEPGYAPLAVDAKLFSRHIPEQGDFYVVYDDGFASISPRKAFLDGYTKIEPKVRALPKPGNVWRHYKGGVYVIKLIGQDEGSQETLVIYQKYSRPEDTVWVRPLSVFMNKVTGHGGHLVNRFERMEG